MPVEGEVTASRHTGFVGDHAVRRLAGVACRGQGARLGSNDVGAGARSVRLTAGPRRPEGEREHDQPDRHGNPRTTHPGGTRFRCRIVRLGVHPRPQRRPFGGRQLRHFGCLRGNLTQRRAGPGHAATEGARPGVEHVGGLRDGQTGQHAEPGRITHVGCESVEGAEPRPVVAVTGVRRAVDAHDQLGLDRRRHNRSGQPHGNGQQPDPRGAADEPRPPSTAARAAERGDQHLLGGIGRRGQLAHEVPHRVGVEIEGLAPATLRAPSPAVRVLHAVPSPIAAPAGHCRTAARR